MLFKPRFTRFLLAAIAILSATVIISGCNTMKGFGKDVEKAGEAIQRSTK